MYITKIYYRHKIVRRSSWLKEATLEKNYSIRANWGFSISVDLVNIVVRLNIPDFLEACSQLTRLEVKRCQAATLKLKYILSEKYKM